MSLTACPRTQACFFERDPQAPIMRRASAEGVGTLLLVFVASSSGLTARALLGGNSALGLLLSALAIAGALTGVILAFGAVSGGHFNPLITGLQWLAGERPLDCTLAYFAAQLGGGVLGALLASTLFHTGGPIIGHTPPNWSMAASELVASAGLMTVVLGCVRGGRAEVGPFAVGAWLVAAIIATPSASYANPAIALGALFAAGPIALPLETVLLYIPAELVGALLAYFVIRTIYRPRVPVAAELVS
jgi:glycerol uptake facilitator-like aquaporin